MRRYTQAADDAADADADADAAAVAASPSADADAAAPAAAAAEEAEEAAGSIDAPSPPPPAEEVGSDDNARHVMGWHVIQWTNCGAPRHEMRCFTALTRFQNLLDNMTGMV